MKKAKSSSRRTKRPNSPGKKSKRCAYPKRRRKSYSRTIETTDSDVDSEEDTDHAAIGASGDDGFTRAEALGKPILPSFTSRPTSKRKEKIDDMKSTMAKESQKLLAEILLEGKAPPARKSSSLVSSSSLDSMD